jgi:hypothetical protein
MDKLRPPINPHFCHELYQCEHLVQAASALKRGSMGIEDFPHWQIFEAVSFAMSARERALVLQNAFVDFQIYMDRHSLIQLIDLPPTE